MTPLAPLLALLVAGSAIATPLYGRQQANVTSPSTSNATSSITPRTIYLDSGIPVTGYTNAQYNVSSFLGIPFATSERFRAPVLIDYSGNSTSGNSTLYARGINATAQGPACMQSPGLGRSLGNGTYTKGGVSEDCLGVNVFGPVGAGNGTKLPVVVWLYGGSFAGGANNIYDGTAIVAQSVLMRSPVLLVAPNYRLNIYGWLNGVEALENNATNLGLKDQLAALQWVQKNIAAFGGDPSKVTVQGESAGAISIALHYLNPAIVGNVNATHGNMTTNMTTMASMNSTASANTSAPLFRGAIMQSGAMSTFAIGPANETRQPIFDRISMLTGCSANASMANPMANGTRAFNQSEFECLRTLPNELLFNATRTVLDDPANSYGAFPFGPTVDFSMVPASPAKLLQQGKFARIPFISGNMLDEGTLFTPPTLNTSAQVVAYINEVLPRDPNSTVSNTLLAYYNNPADGSPYGTGNTSSLTGAPYLSPLFKQISSLFGDTTFQSSRRDFLQRANQYNMTQTWSYLFSQKRAGTENSYLGASHGSDVLYAFGLPGNATSDIAVARQYVGYFVNFANTLNPNGNASNPINGLVSSTLNLTSWPAYSTPTNGGNANMLQFLYGNNTVIQDTFRSSSIAYINSVPEALDH